MRHVPERWNRQIYCSKFHDTWAVQIYVLDSVVLNKAGTIDSIEYASLETLTHADTGIIVDDTLRHFTAIGEQWGDLNNDGIPDLVLNGLNANDNRDGNEN